MFGWFKRTPKKWIGTITATWIYDDKTETKIFYHLYIKGDKRKIETEGLTPMDHPLYQGRLVPWLNGAPDALIFKDVNYKLVEYWGETKEKTESKPEFKLYNFEKKPDESA